MKRHGFRFPFLAVLLVFITQGAVASEKSPSEVTEQTAEEKSTQQKGMDENLQDSVPTADLQEQQNQQDLQNPRLVIQENLKESPDVRVVFDSDWQLKTMSLDGHTHMSAPPASFRQGMTWLFSKD